MKFRLELFFLLLSINFIYSQNIESSQFFKINDTIDSNYLDEKRFIEIQLPKSYNPDEKRKYPLLLVLDGDYLFKLVSGSVDYLSYWEEIPENIVVGIKQKKSRFKDSSVLDEISNTPISHTASFYDFIVNELLPYLEKNFSLSDFRIIVGQERTANFANFFLFKPKLLFRGFISISPKLSNEMHDYLNENLEKIDSRVVYTLTTSKKDFESIFSNVSKLSVALDSIKNENLIFNSLIFEEENHYILPSVSIPKSLRKTFSLYSNIDKVEYDSIISVLDSSPIDYLINKYDLIEEIYDVKKIISINDFRAIEEYIENNEKYELYNELYKLASKDYDDTILPSYYKGRYFEETGKLKKAMHTYRSAYIMNEVDGLTKDYLLDLADNIQRDFDLK